MRVLEFTVMIADTEVTEQEFELLQNNREEIEELLTQELYNYLDTDKNSIFEDDFDAQEEEDL